MDVKLDKKIEQLRDEEMQFKRCAAMACANDFELESKRVNTVAADEAGQLADWLEELKRYREVEKIEIPGSAAFHVVAYGGADGRVTGVSEDGSPYLVVNAVGQLCAIMILEHACEGRRLEMAKDMYDNICKAIERFEEEEHEIH